MKDQYIRCRSIIIKDGCLLVTQGQNKSHDYYALPGGKLEFGETPHECIVRELLEELGVVAKVGNLLYVSTFTETQIAKQHVEFLFRIDNPQDFSDTISPEATHAYELSNVEWLNRNDSKKVLRPIRVQADFDSDKLSGRPTVFIG